MPGVPFDKPYIIEGFKRVEALTDEMFAVFGETLTDEELGLPTDDEAVAMVNSLLGKDDDQ